MASKKPTLASPIAAEDLRRGHYVSVLYVIDQNVPFCLEPSDRAAPINIRLLPDNEPCPLKVVDICLPYVVVLTPSGLPHTLDVRRYELARLDDGYARRVVKLLRAPRGPKSRRRSS